MLEETQAKRGVHKTPPKLASLYPRKSYVFSPLDPVFTNHLIAER